MDSYQSTDWALPDGARSTLCVLYRRFPVITLGDRHYFVAVSQRRKSRLGGVK